MKRGAYWIYLWRTGEQLIIGVWVFPPTKSYTGKSLCTGDNNFPIATQIESTFPSLSWPISSSPSQRTHTIRAEMHIWGRIKWLDALPPPMRRCKQSQQVYSKWCFVSRVQLKGPIWLLFDLEDDSSSLVQHGVSLLWDNSIAEDTWSFDRWVGERQEIPEWLGLDRINGVLVWMIQLNFFQASASPSRKRQASRTYSTSHNGWEWEMRKTSRPLGARFHHLHCYPFSAHRVPRF